MKYVVYKTTNKINGKIYIGVHKKHKEKDWYIGSGRAILAAKAKYGLKNFYTEILYEYDNDKDAYKKEAELVNEDFVLRDDTYNLVPGGKGGPGKKQSDEAKRAISLSKLGKPRSEETKAKVSKTRLERKIPSPNKGKKLSEAHKLALSKVRKGRKTNKPMPDSTKEALRIANSKPHSKERTIKKQKPIIIDGIKYSSCTEVSDVFNISASLVTYRLKSSKWPGWKYD